MMRNNSFTAGATAFMTAVRSSKKYNYYFLPIYELIRNELTNIELRKVSDFDDHISGSIKFTEPDLYIISHNGSHGENRQRFTIAHELGHYFLHKEILHDGKSIVDNTMYRSNLSDRYEIQANRFAANLLMPYSLIEKYKYEHRDRGVPIKQIARAFGVSEIAMSLRLGIPY